MELNLKTCTRDMFESMNAGVHFDRLTQFTDVGAKSLLCFELDNDETWLLNNQLNNQAHRTIKMKFVKCDFSAYCKTDTEEGQRFLNNLVLNLYAVEHTVDFTNVW